MEVIYNERKKAYENTVMNLDSEKSKLDTDVSKMHEEYKSDETKYHKCNIDGQIYDAYLKRLSSEAKYINAPEKRLSNEFKSYSEFFNTKVRRLIFSCANKITSSKT
jgi:uncharacterized protein (UPF0335 family)